MRPHRLDPPTRQPVSPDAVVVVPGIMGSTLETESGVIWGMNRLGWYLEAWMHQGSALDELVLTPQEREGQYGRVRATGLLAAPAWAPFLQGLEPYQRLLDGIRAELVHPDALIAFPYDWRLPIAYNSGLLASFMRNHLERWIASNRYKMFAAEYPQARRPSLVVVAHSMGGLLTLTLPDDLDLRAVVTLGTPFTGAAKSALILNSGRGAPVKLPRTRLRAMAHTLPGIHDLLPSYRCVDDVVDENDPTRLTPGLVADLGGDADLAAAAFDWRQQVRSLKPRGHRCLVGIDQPTESSLTYANGILVGHHYSFATTPDGLERDREGRLVRVDLGGDGTVPEGSATATTSERTFQLAQQHGPIAKAKESIDFVRAVLREGDPHAEQLGEGTIGIVVEDVVDEGETVPVGIIGIGGPDEATVVITDEDGMPVAHPTPVSADGAYQAVFGPFGEGIYQVSVEGGGTSAVTQRVLVASE